MVIAASDDAGGLSSAALKTVVFVQAFSSEFT